MQNIHLFLAILVFKPLGTDVARSVPILIMLITWFHSSEYFIINRKKDALLETRDLNSRATIYVTRKF
jgi:hypothetical protein